MCSRTLPPRKNGPRGEGTATRRLDIPALDTVLFHSNLSTLPRKYLSDILTGKIVFSCGPNISKRTFLMRYWWVTKQERKFHFRFVERRFLTAIAPGASKERSCQSFSVSHIGIFMYSFKKHKVCELTSSVFCSFFMPV